MFTSKKNSMSNPFSNTNWSEVPKWKLFVYGAIALIVLSIALSIIKLLFSGFYSSTGSSVSNDMSLSVSEMGYAPAPAMFKGMSDSDSFSNVSREESTQSVGDDAENYEALSYNVIYKDKSIENICNAIESWKPLSYVVFEYATRNDTQCNYRFKVERTYVDGILENIKTLDPDNFTANTATMKKQVVEYEGQLAILLRQQDILEETLISAKDSYDDVAQFAREQGDSESLTRTINSKLATIKNLTTERGNLANQIESLARRSAEIQDQIQYVSFSVRVEKYKVLDVVAMKDSWVYKMRTFVLTTNATLQGLTIGVLELLLNLLQIIVYVGVVISVFLGVGRFGLRASKKFWKEDTPHE